MKTPTQSSFTGRHMLTIMVAFFGVIIAVNVTMATLANTSWTGFVVRNSYVAGLEFNRKAEEGRRQAALGWTSRIEIASGKLVFALTDAAGQPVHAAGGEATFRRPVSDAEDVTVALAPSVAGTLAAAVDIADGSWIIEFNVDAGQGTPWHEMERVHVREGRTR